MSSIASYMQANTTHQPDPRYGNNPEHNHHMENEFATSNNANPQNNVGNQVKTKFRLKLSQRLHYSAEIAFVSYLLLIISFGSPYWLASYSFTHSAFKRLGLWDFCFQDYVHPAYQYDTRFSGCHWIYSPVYTNIRDWLQPGWFLFIQATITLGLCISTIGLSAVSLIFMHYLIQYQLIILCLTLICHLATTMFIGFGLLTFYAKAFDRNWILYPDYNYLAWAYYFALFSLIGNAISSYLYYKEVKELRGRMLKMKRLIVSTNERQEMAGNGHHGTAGGGGDMDSIDAVYASRSVHDVYQSVPVVGNESQRSRSQQQQQHPSTTMQPNDNVAKKPDLMYPFYTQV